MMATEVLGAVVQAELATRCTCNGKTNADGQGGKDCQYIESGKTYCYTDVNACQDGQTSNKIANAEFSFAACAIQALAGEATQAPGAVTGYTLKRGASGPMASKTLDANLIEGILRSSVIYHDGTACSSYSMGCTQADVKVSFQLRDSTTFSVGVCDNVQCPKTKVEIELRPLATPLNVQPQKFVKDCSGDVCQ